MGFFNQSYNSAKCKTALGVSMGRLKLVQNKKSTQVNGLRRELATLLATGKEESARIKVEGVLREMNLQVVLEVCELFCELLTVRQRQLEADKACPSDLKEAVATLMYVSERTSEIPELTSVRKQLGARYGKEFVAAAVRDASAAAFGVNRIVLEKLTTAPPPPAAKLALLKEIAEQHDVQWEPSDVTTSSMLGSPPSVLEIPPSEGGSVAVTPYPSQPVTPSVTMPPSLPDALTAAWTGVTELPAPPHYPPMPSPPPPCVPPSSSNAPPAIVITPASHTDTPASAATPASPTDAAAAAAYTDPHAQYMSAARAADDAVNAAQTAAAAAGTVYVPVYVTDSYAAAPTPIASGTVEAELQADVAAAGDDVAGDTPAAAAAAAAAPADDHLPAPSEPPPLLPDDDVDVSAGLPTPPLERPQPPAATKLPPPPPTKPASPPPAVDDSFDDLAKRFEALKRRN